MAARRACRQVMIVAAAVFLPHIGVPVMAQEELPFPLVEQGRPRAVICAGEQAGPVTRLGIGALQRRVGALSGVELPVVTGAGGQASDTLILVGTPEDNPLLRGVAADEGVTINPADLGPQGFRLLTLTTRDGRRCILTAGVTDQGAYHACRWLARRILADGDRVLVGPLDLTQRPAMEVRGVYDGEWQSDVLTLTRHGDRFHPDNLPWWEEYIDRLASFGANHFEVWPILTSGLAGLSPEQLQAQQEWIRSIAGFCHRRGMELYLVAAANVISGAYTRDHPELQAEGVGGAGWVCPSKPGGTELLLDAVGEAVKTVEGSVDGVVFYGYDPGGCGCSQCGGLHKDYYRTYMRLMKAYRDHFRKIAPRVKVSAILWFFHTDERQKLLADIEQWPRDLEIQADIYSYAFPPYLRPIEPEWVEVVRGLARTHRVLMWDHETDMETLMWLENPLPARIGERVELAHEAGCAGVTGFILSHPVKLINSIALVLKAWDPALSTEEVLREFALEMFASAAPCIVEALLLLNEWTEQVGDTAVRMVDWGVPALPDQVRRWQAGLASAGRAADLLAQAQDSVRLGSDYYAYLQHLTRACGLICARLLKQNQASARMVAWEEMPDLSSRIERLGLLRGLLRQTGGFNAQVARELAQTPLAALISMPEDPSFQGTVRDAIYDAGSVERQLARLADWRRDACSLAAEFENWRAGEWERGWPHRARVLVSIPARAGEVGEEPQTVLVRCPLHLAASPAMKLVEHDAAGMPVRETPCRLRIDGEQAWLYWNAQVDPATAQVKRYCLYLDPGREGMPQADLPGLLQDPSLERRAECWEAVADAGPPLVGLEWSDDAHTGSTAALLRVRESCNNYVLLATAADSARALAVKTGREYRVSFWYRVLEGASGSFYVDLFSGPEGDGVNATPGLIADGEWHRCSLKVPAPQFPAGQAAALRFVAYYEPQAILIDDIEVVEDPAPLVLVGEMEAVPATR